MDSTAAILLLAVASRLLNSSDISTCKIDLESITLYTKSVQKLQRRLNANRDALSEGVIIAVLEFAWYDVRTSILRHHEKLLIAQSF